MDSNGNGKPPANQIRIAIAASFTGEPIEPSLKFWAGKFGYEPELKFSPYGQIFQQLIDKNSVLNDHLAQARVVCLRIEDWLRDISISDTGQVQSYLTDNILAFCEYVKEAHDYASAPLFIYITENSPNSFISSESQIKFEKLIREGLLNTNNVFVSSSEDIRELYAVSKYYDAQRDSLGHIPFTDEYFAALGTTVIRRILANQRSPYKVIVLDCDNTLWGGVCGEVGSDGIILSEPFRYLQSFMLKQTDSGKILCLCSKNSREDVDSVFNNRKDMVLKENDIVASKVNWQPKSMNIRELSVELNLGLDSFIFIDDNPVECAEVRAQCPEVLTLNLPEKTEDIPLFLDHVWAFDHLSTTSEDKNRTKLYKENIKRSGFQNNASSMKDFIAGLNLEVEIRAPHEDEISRVSQLTFRTNQFNFTTIRRTEQEIKKLLRSDYTCKICRVRDRFGDYGLVGVLIFSDKGEYLELDSLMLSCRVLGRGVEHKMLQSLAGEARNRNLKSIKINFDTTNKNLPARKFLDSVMNGTDSLLFSTDYLLNLEFDPDKSGTDGTQTTKNSSPVFCNSYPGLHNKLTFEMIGKELNSVSDIQNGIMPKKNYRNSHDKDAGERSDTDVEKLITGIWEDVLDTTGIQTDQHFFDVGGTSLKAVEVLSNLNTTFDKNYTVVSLFEHSTIQSLVNLVQGKSLSNNEFDKILERAGSRRNRLRKR